MAETGRLFQINVSDGGVPKRALAVAEVTQLGVVGDRQRDKRHHGGPERAVCLYSLERILALQAEGHPIYPGAIGENLTVSGLDWEQMRPGVALQVGPDVRLVLTSYAVPCSNITFALDGGSLKRVSQKVNPGWSRVYARVLQPGTVRPGDEVSLLSEQA